MSGVAGRPAGRDPGLQPERTRMAWRRTTLSSTLVLVLAGKAVLADQGAVGWTAGALCFACWVTMVLVAHRRIRRLAGPGEPALLEHGEALPVALCVAVTVVCAAWLVLHV